MTTKKGKIVPLWIEHNGRKVVAATIRGDTLCKKVLGSQHFLIEPPAIAFQKSVLVRAIKAGVKSIDVFDVESRTHYLASMDVMKAKGFVIERGDGKQVALMMGEWRLHKAGFKQLVLPIGGPDGTPGEG